MQMQEPGPEEGRCAERLALVNGSLAIQVLCLIPSSVTQRSLFSPQGKAGGLWTALAKEGPCGCQGILHEETPGNLDSW